MELEKDGQEIYISSEGVLYFKLTLISKSYLNDRLISRKMEIESIGMKFNHTISSSNDLMKNEFKVIMMGTKTSH